MITKCYDYEEIDYMGLDGIRDVRGGDGAEDVCCCQCGGSCAYQGGSLSIPTITIGRVRTIGDTGL